MWKNIIYSNNSTKSPRNFVRSYFDWIQIKLFSERLDPNLLWRSIKCWKGIFDVIINQLFHFIVQLYIYIFNGRLNIETLKLKSYILWIISKIKDRRIKIIFTNHCCRSFKLKIMFNMQNFIISIYFFVRNL